MLLTPEGKLSREERYVMMKVIGCNIGGDTWLVEVLIQ